VLASLPAGRSDHVGVVEQILADELGGEQAPEVVRGEPDGFAVIGEGGPVGGGVEQVADGEEGRYSWSAAVSRSGSVLGPTARIQRLGGYATDEVALAARAVRRPPPLVRIFANDLVQELVRTGRARGAEPGRREAVVLSDR
jgi:hypothetical protein